MTRLTASIATAFCLTGLPVFAASTDTSGGQLPEIVTQAHSANAPGEYGNPNWTKHRRFATTRVFVQRDAWEVGVEQWYRVRKYDDGSSRHLFSEEIEVGLPFRAQLDLYYDWVHEKGETDFKDFAAEIRWALADWDVIPLNPTLYAEYKWVDPDHGDDVLELKLLLGDDIGPDWQYGLNVVWEQELAGEKTTEWQGLAALSRTLNETFSVGAEFKYVHETVAGDRGNPEHKVLFGPSVQWRPTANTHVDVVGLFGLTKDAPDVEGWVVIGFDLGKVGGAKKARRPVSGVRD